MTPSYLSLGRRSVFLLQCPRGDVIFFSAAQGQRSVPGGPTHDATAQPPPNGPCPGLSERASPSAPAGAGGSAGDGEEESKATSGMADQSDDAKQEGSQSDGVKRPCEEEAGGDATMAKVSRPMGGTGAGSGSGGGGGGAQYVEAAGQKQRVPSSSDAVCSSGALAGSDGGEGGPFSADAVGKLGKGLALMLARRRLPEQQEKEGKEDGHLGAAAETGGGDVAAAEAAGSTVLGELRSAAVVAPAAASKTPIGDETRDNDTPSPGAAPPSLTQVKTQGAQVEAPPAEQKAAPPAVGTHGARSDVTAGANGGSVSTGGVRAAGAEDGGVSKPGSAMGGSSNGKAPRRRAMLAPPVSPPRVVASAENDPQLDCTLNTLEAVHGAFYAPENNHGQPRWVGWRVELDRCGVVVLRCDAYCSRLWVPLVAEVE